MTKEALAQQQEPVAWWHRKSDTFTSGNLVSNFVEWSPLYTSPQAKPWVGLTDEEIEAAAKWADKNGAPWHLEFAKTIEAKLKEKNT